MRLLVFTTIILLLTALSVCSAVSVDDVYRSVEELKGLSDVTVGSAGTSAEGRDIPFMVITDPQTDPAEKMRVLVMAGQHGNEMAAVEGAISMAGYLAFDKGEDAAGLKCDVLFIIVPLVNPDGAIEGTRENGRGIDLNRNWPTQTQPEVRAVAALDKAWKPEIIIDLHEWLEGDQGVSDFIETSHPIGAKMMRESSAGGGVLKLVYNTPEANPSLVHRYFSSRGVPAFLIESRRRGSDVKLLTRYRQASFDLINSALKHRGETGFRSGTWDMPPIVTRHTSKAAKTKPAGRPASGMMGLLLVGCYILLLAVLRSSSGREVEQKRRVKRRMGVLPRPEHDIIYWMNRPKSLTRGSKRNAALL